MKGNDVIDEIYSFLQENTLTKFYPFLTGAARMNLNLSKVIYLKYYLSWRIKVEWVNNTFSKIGQIWENVWKMNFWNCKSQNFKMQQKNE